MLSDVTIKIIYGLIDVESVDFKDMTELLYESKVHQSQFDPVLELLTPTDIESTLRTYLSTGASIMLLFTDGVVVGMSIYQVKKNRRLEGHTLYTYETAIRGGYRGRGIAGILFNEIERATENKFGKIWVECKVYYENKQSRRHLEKMGYKPFSIHMVKEP